MNMKSIIVLFLILIICLGCLNGVILERNIHFGESFTLKVNKSISISSATNNSNIEIYFSKINFDSRCPLSICNSCYGSTASINLLLINKKDTSNIPLTILGCRDEYECNDQLYYRKDTLGYRFCLLRLDPYPDGNIQVNPIHYLVKINIERL